MFIAFSGIMSAFIIVGYTAIMIGFRPRHDQYISETTCWFLRAFRLLTWTIVFRAFYWDIFMPTFRWAKPAAAQSWAEMTAGRLMNVVFGLFLLGSIYALLKCRQAMIPLEERKNWPWYIAWRHPKRITFLFWRW